MVMLLIDSQRFLVGNRPIFIYEKKFNAKGNKKTARRKLTLYLITARGWVV